MAVETGFLPGLYQAKIVPLVGKRIKVKIKGFMALLDMFPEMSNRIEFFTPVHSTWTDVHDALRITYLNACVTLHSIPPHTGASVSAFILFIVVTFVG